MVCFEISHTFVPWDQKTHLVQSLQLGQGEGS